MLAHADVISLHCPPPQGGRPLIGAEELALIKTGTLLVNTARAELLDQAALADALAQGRLGGVAVDVFEQEPPNNIDLLRDGRVIATPHIGGFTAESVGQAVTVAVNNLLAALD